MSVSMTPSVGTGDSGLPVIVVTGMAFEARIARGDGSERVEVVYAARADLLERALNAAVARGAAGIVSFGTAGGLAPDLQPGALIVADAVHGPFGRIDTDWPWTERIAAAVTAEGLAGRLRRGAMAAVAAPLITAEDKRALHESTGALAVDMESHIAGATAAAHGLPFVVCRAIVDPAWRTLPPAATAGLRDDGTTALGPILRELLRQPSQLGALLRLAGDARAARTTLVEAREALGKGGALRIAGVNNCATGNGG
ncbi:MULTISPECIES: phosphorylase [unclassified Paraburkholderia]|uniref:phosphorylase n=1 Tax=unclassified Paraburkholderia TaxID=2615204 RepID=UPI00161A7B48|nr:MULTISPECIES: phosphorylase [unclassified Paraburkholderia]MBB5443015.1 hopanoid-associated phosphorylase [Paraburkholderia sp. WSM4177]MBB5483380.1 hopanoid-associated phosphorylase [Paraburkholderia sp. WSM4180]